jgi:hypothetical protein
MSHSCSRCGRECKDNRGLAIHQSKCGEPGREPVCPHCNTVFTCYRNLTRHYLTCKVFREQEENRQKQLTIDQLNNIQQTVVHKEMTIQELQSLIQTLQDKEKEHLALLRTQTQEYQSKLMQQEQEYKAQLAFERHSNETFANMCKEDQRILSQEKESLCSKIVELEHLNKEQKERLYHLEKKNDMLNINMIEFAKKAADKSGTTIYQTNTNSSVQNGTLNLQHFDASLFRDKINPPNRMIYSILNLVDHSHRFGLGNCYRSLDRSRNVVVWIDQDGTEIRDSNCSQLCERLLLSMDDDIKRQLDYQQQRATYLEGLEGNEHLDELNHVNSNIIFCRQLLDRNIKLMKSLQKELSKKAKNKTDTTVDVPRLVGYTKFIVKLEEALFPDVYKWIGLSFEDFGKWLATTLSDHIDYEGAALYKEKKFIKLQNDEGQSQVVYAPEFGNMIRTLYNEIISLKAKRAYHPFVSYHPQVAKYYEKMMNWIEEGDDTYSESIVTGIILRKLNRNSI